MNLHQYVMINLRHYGDYHDDMLHEDKILFLIVMLLNPIQ